MNKNRVISFILTLAMIAGFVSGAKSVEAANKTPTLSKSSISINVKGKTTVKVKKNSVKKITKTTWKQTKNTKKIVKIDGKKTSAKITGIAVGTANINVVIKYKKTKKAKIKSVVKKLKIRVKSASPSETPLITSTPASTTTPVGTTTPANSAEPEKSSAPTSDDKTILNTYKDIIPHLGNCLNLNGWSWGSQKREGTLRVDESMKWYQTQFNSFTMENDMKPDAILSSQETLISVEQANKLGYHIPDNYKEEKVPKLNFDNIDQEIEAAHKYSLHMRAHTLMWHEQTPDWFFTENYSGSSTVSTDVMDGRLEFYIRTVMEHVMDKEIELTGAAGSIVYCWDVVNEYIHRNNKKASISWTDVYGDMELEPTYVKKAYEIAYDELLKYGIQEKVTLFYNDFDEYNVVNEIVKLTEYINDGEKADICGGIGMQSHISISYPGIDLYAKALDKFISTGLEVQITELDIKQEDDQTAADLAGKYHDIMSAIISAQKNRDRSSTKGITGLTIWGLYDKVSWLSPTPGLLFGSGIDDPKPAYYSFLDAADA